jgi:thioredoxin reductase
MKNILGYIDQKKHEFAKLPFFNFLQDKTVSPQKRLSFGPCAAPFIMSFGELNKSVLRDESSDDQLQQLINKHTHEDDHHWVWFLGDLRKLGLDESMRFTDVLRFVWGQETQRTRNLCRKLIEYASQATPIQKLIVIEVIEATAQVAAAHIAPVAKELESFTKKTYRYFGEQHLAAESGHAADSPESEHFIQNLKLSDVEIAQAYEVVDEIFNVFTEFTNELLRYAKMQSNPYWSENSRTDYEYLIIGAGPAGLQLGYYLEKSKRDYLILEAGNSPGTFFKEFPRHRKLISINKCHTGYDDPEINLRWDWNSLLSDSEEMLFKNYSKQYFPDADKLVDYLGDFANHFDLNIRYDVRVTKIAKDQKFMIIDEKGKVYSCKHLIIATGCTKLYVPDIPGIELAEKYTNVSVNPDDFENQRVLIIGKGNSAFETADNLIDTAAMIHVCSPHSISMAWKTKYVGHLRAVNNNFLDTYQLKSQNLILNAHIDNIEQNDDGKYIVSVSYTHANGEVEDLEYDRIIVCTGFRFDDSIFDDSCKPNLTINNRFPAQTSSWESTNIQDLFFAGILMHMRDFKKKQSGFIHGFRYNIKALHQIFECRFHQKTWEHSPLVLNPNTLTDAILSRTNRSSALWQQTGFLSDVIIVSEQEQQGKYLEEVPTDYLLDSELGKHNHYYTISLDFGHKYLDAFPDPFAIERVHKDDIENAEQSPSLHPIIRRYCQSKLVAEHHVIEDIASEWREDVHIQPLLKFMTEQLAQPQSIGSRLLQAGLLTSEQLETALAEQEIGTVARLEEILKNRGWVKERTIQFMLDKVVNKPVDDPRYLQGYSVLGAYLVDADLVTQEQVDQALQEQKMSGQRVGKILADHGWVPQEAVEYIMKHVVIPERNSKSKVAVLN